MGTKGEETRLQLKYDEKTFGFILPTRLLIQLAVELLQSLNDFSVSRFERCLRVIILSLLVER